MAARPNFWRAPLGAWSGQPAFILGGGPSLSGFDVSRLRGKGRVIGVNNAGLDLAPWSDILYFADGDSRWYGWNKDRLDLFEGDWIVSRAPLRAPDPRVHRVRHDLQSALSTDPAALAGVCGGANALNLAHLLGASPIVLLGFDMRPGNWHDLHRLPIKPGQHRDKFIPALERMAAALGEWPVINCNLRSALRCFPFAPIEELLAMDDLALIEADKYRQIWARPEYRKISPGMIEAPSAFEVCEMKAGDSLIDFGAGTGRATRWFADRGLDVLAVDFAHNALEEAVPVVNACLWEMGDAVAPADLGYCCDVMEHVPAVKVQAVLAAIRERTRRACYFRIATRPDRMGRLIGQTLHLTVKSGEWWRRQVEAHWALVDVIEMNARDVVLLARP